MTHGVVTLVLGSIIKVCHDNINNYDKDQVALALKHNLTNVKKNAKEQVSTLLSEFQL
jgi:hypothetical protein